MAWELVSRYHGIESANEARDNFQSRFSQREFPSEPDANITLADSDVQFLDKPSIWIIALLEKTGLIASRNEARRFVQQGGIELDGVRLTNLDEKISLEEEKTYRLRIGKRKSATFVYKAG